jgi:hypothetical protein
MNDDDRLVQLLRSALPPTGAVGPSRDLWPRVAGRMGARVRVSWLDLALAAVVAAALLIHPAWLRLLAYHL